jgi:hypothetical protein
LRASQPFEVSGGRLGWLRSHSTDLARGLALPVSLALPIAPVVSLLWVASVAAGTLVPSNVVPLMAAAALK